MNYSAEPHHFGAGYSRLTPYGEKNGQVDRTYECGASALPNEIFKTPAGKSSCGLPHKPVARALFQSESPTRCDSYTQSYDQRNTVGSMKTYTSSHYGSKIKTRPFDETCCGSPPKKSTSAKCKTAKTSKTLENTVASSDDFH